MNPSNSQISQDSYHWISKAIDTLDPETDYETIWRLTSSYQLSDFANNLIYTLTFPNFVIPLHGAEVVWRSDGGKVVHKAVDRVEKTEHYNMAWWYYGPSDQRCRDAVERINQLHAGLARQYPGRFSHNEDYLYTLTFSAVLMHRLRIRLGLSGFTEKQQIAAHHFWRDMGPLFEVEGKGNVKDYPADFDGCIAFCEAYENTPREYNEKARYIGLSIFNLFAYRYFPPGLRWFGMAFPRTLSLPTTLSAFRIEPANPLLAAIVIFIVRAVFLVTEVLLPDPKVPFFERLETLPEVETRRRKEEMRALDKSYEQFIMSQLSGPGCPFSAKVQ
ncbi:hypothetical protein CaCOL14_012592 [Colletotrichum acutatum]|uniref:ER-bound oxygenase mpaB/mpaB'/Rubber oxygenase catalytic domain-containing protein n=1 Tax=Glomerella acutata TaxID=27357 RepID=A0AAD8UR17_GLOAC|nr:uncharacterized protein BDZ83DRAFT_571684 [Colletotrichum acutatum]KAK1727878.1 hypothetical protein BDZ83DRAFT_571684 [Colletotrichum acutatum]